MVKVENKTGLRQLRRSEGARKPLPLALRGFDKEKAKEARLRFTSFKFRSGVEGGEASGGGQSPLNFKPLTPPSNLRGGLRFPSPPPGKEARINKRLLGFNPPKPEPTVGFDNTPFGSGDHPQLQQSCKNPPKGD
ncbi:hypothetical protein RRG08_002893 [Elysia crispata]|uniref:Uncharacterized protein n=1 Tax=Elysia crispata TaxID=231223 RepID=A0AAE0XRG8_9GAST|nr:hypothetical protein RRG08_002893 [Elysia crispata]